MKDYLPTKEQIKQEEKEYAESLFKTLTELSEKAFEMGITINQVSLHDNHVEVYGKGRSLYGDRYILKAPKIKVIETPYMSIKVK